MILPSSEISIFSLTRIRVQHVEVQHPEIQESESSSDDEKTNTSSPKWGTPSEISILDQVSKTTDKEQEALRIVENLQEDLSDETPENSQLSYESVPQITEFPPEPEVESIDSPNQTSDDSFQSAIPETLPISETPASEVAPPTEVPVIESKETSGEVSEAKEVQEPISQVPETVVVSEAPNSIPETQVVEEAPVAIETPAETPEVKDSCVDGVETPKEENVVTTEEVAKETTNETRQQEAAEPMKTREKRAQTTPN